MREELMQSEEMWQVISHLGSSSLLLPVLLITATGLWQSEQRKTALVWLGSLTLAITICLTSKVAFIGWGIGIESINFTGVSGHTLFATSVLPVTFHLLLQTWASLRHRYWGMGVGLALGLLVAISRVALHAHSWSEVVPGWLLGALVMWITLRSTDTPQHVSRLFLAAPALLLFALEPAASTYLPTHRYEIGLALLLSGHDQPFVRSDPEEVR